MNRKLRYQPRHARRTAHAGTHILTFSRRPNWVAVWITVTIVAIILALVAFILVVIP